MLQVSVVHTYYPSTTATHTSPTSTLSPLLFSFPVDDRVATIHFFEASISNKVLVGKVVDKNDATLSNVNDTEKHFIPTVDSTKDRDRFQV